MSDKKQALVVDDEAAIRRLTVKALQQCDFVCDEAADGDQALERLAARKYDVVVTDLRMPRRNGHSLAVELIGQGEDRPLVVVLTGVLEPRLAADLIARGIDDIVFKPVDFSLFGAKVRALSERRARRNRQSAEASPNRTSEASPASLDLPTIRMDDIEQRLDAMAGALPVSHAAIDVANLLNDDTPSTAEIARLIARDPSLAVEVLRLANSAHYYRGGDRIDDLQQAVLRIGHSQISQLALASTTLRALTNTALPWVNPHLMWNRSLAGSLAIERLHPSAELGKSDEGLFLSSLLLPMSRVLMGLAFPDLYLRMIAHCRESGSSLASLERRLLPMPPVRAMAGMLVRWNLSPRLFKPLQQSGLPYHELCTLTQPLRGKVEQLRVAELLGQLAVGQFEPWDEMEFPLPETMHRLRVHEFGQIVEQIRSDLEPGPSCAPKRDAGRADALPNCLGRALEVRYHKLSMEPYDLLTVLLDALKLKVVHLSRADACQAGPMLVNCTDTSQERLESFLDDAVPHGGRTLVRNARSPSHGNPEDNVVELPCSFRAFSDAVFAGEVKA